MHEHELVVGDEQYKALEDLLSDVENGHDAVITKNGEKVAVVISYDEYLALNKLTEVFGTE